MWSTRVKLLTGCWYQWCDTICVARASRTRTEWKSNWPTNCVPTQGEHQSHAAEDIPVSILSARMVPGT